MIINICQVFLDFQSEEGKEVNKVQISEAGEKKENTDFTAPNLILLKKAIWKLKGEWAFRISFPSMGWEGSEIAMEIHCDAGQILTKNGSKEQLGICGFMRKQITEQTRNDDLQKGAIDFVGKQ